MIQKKMMGLSKNYVGSEVLFDNTDFFTRTANVKANDRARHLENFTDFVEFGKALFQEKPTREMAGMPTRQSAAPVQPVYGYANGYAAKSYTSSSMASNNTAYCIRSGERISFNLKRPFSDTAYASWSRHKNAKYAEKFCHACGNKHATSMHKP